MVPTSRWVGQKYVANKGLKICDPIQGRNRTLEQIARELWEWAKKEMRGEHDSLAA